MIRSVLAAAALAACVAPALAQDPGPPPQGEPGPTTEIIGPESSFRLKPDGVDWERFESGRAIGVRCPEDKCGAERVFCVIQVRGAAGAKAGETVAADVAQEFGDGFLRHALKSSKAEYVAPFAERSFGANAGRWAEVRAEEAGPVRYGLFLVSVNRHFVAFDCVAPAARWDDARPKIETLLAGLEIIK